MQKERNLKQKKKKSFFTLTRILKNKTWIKIQITNRRKQIKANINNSKETYKTKLIKNKT